MAQKYDLTDIGNALSRVMDNPMTKIIRSGSIGVLGVVNPVAGIVGGIGNDLLSEYNTFKLGHLLNGLASGFNLERRLNELYNYVNSSPEKAIIVANLFKQTVNAECPKVCVIYGLILANHLETLTEFTHEELIVCKALENATDYDLKNFKEIMENYLKPTSNGRRIVFPDSWSGSDHEKRRAEDGRNQRGRFCSCKIISGHCQTFGSEKKFKRVFRGVQQEKYAVVFYRRGHEVVYRLAGYARCEPVCSPCFLL